MSLRTANGTHQDKVQRNHAKSTKPKRNSTFSKAAEFLIKHQIELPLAIISTIGMAYLCGIPQAEKFLYIQYRDPETGLYTKGKDDLYFISFWVAVFTFLRASVMEHLLAPIAKKKGIKPTRFAEQGWLFMYYSTSWTLGMYVMYHSPHWFDTSQFWKDYPHIHLTYMFKWYYLVQLSFWLQQVFVINIEKRRKDFAEMVIHHAITISLIGVSYYCNYTRIGNAVLCIMDFADILLPLAKALKYLGYSRVCDVLFVLFMISWIITRHGFYSFVIYSTWKESHQYLKYNWLPEEGFYFTENSQRFFLSMFLALQALIYFWFYLIFQIAFRVVKGESANDTRSDCETEEEQPNTRKKRKDSQ